MKTLHKGVALVAFFLLLLGCLTEISLAQGELAPWFNYHYGSAEVVAHSQQEEGERLLFDGFLRFDYPDQFQVAYGTTGGVVIISSFADFLEFQVKGEFQYGYDKHWLVERFEQYFLGLVEYSKDPLEYSGSTQIANRDVFRYQAVDNPELILWVDQQTKIPLLIREGKTTLVTVESYSVKAGSDEVELELALLYSQYPAQLTLNYTDDRWLPKRLVVNSATESVTIEFKRWNLDYDWVVDSPTGKLAQLRDLNDAFFRDFATQEWSTALHTCQKMLVLAPQYWQVYLYQAFVYEGLGNFLGAVENYQQVIMREPTNALALNNLAFHYLIKEVQIPQALVLAEQAVSLERKPAYLDTLGYGYYLVGRFTEALELLEEALEDAEEESIEEINSHLELVLKALAGANN